jgi:hypothetical protein
MLAKDKTPILAGVIPVFETFMAKWDILAEKRPWLKPFINEGIYWAEKYISKPGFSAITGHSIGTKWYNEV